MSNLKDLKLKDVEVLNDITLMSSSSNGDGGDDGSGIEVTLPEVVITPDKGSGSGSGKGSGSGAGTGTGGSTSGSGGNSAATCTKCGTPYNTLGLCPYCDLGSGSGYNVQEGRWDNQKMQCGNLSIGAKCSYLRDGKIVNGTCKEVFWPGEKMCTDKTEKTEVCMGKTRGVACGYMYGGKHYRGFCGGSLLGELHCSEYGAV